MSYVAVIPSIFQPYTDDCLATCKLSNTLVVDNTVENKGVAASWNLGVQHMYDHHADWLLIISAAMRFGDKGGLELVEAMNDDPFAIALEGAWGLGWHFIAFNRRVFDDVGTFDERYFPGYMEDLDFAYRVHRHYKVEPPYWKKIDVDGYVRSFAHATRYAGVEADHDKLLAIYVGKHGGPPGQETR